jgi:hypothetical protein
MRASIPLLAGASAVLAIVIAGIRMSIGRSTRNALQRNNAASDGMLNPRHSADDLGMLDLEFGAPEDS